MVTGSAALAVVKGLGATPDLLFQSLFLALGATAVIAKIADRDTSNKDNEEKMPAAMRSLQIRFLAVFWMMRMADWLQGPYFYEVYSSKIIGGAQVSLDMVSKFFLVGFGVTGLLGPFVGKLVDNRGRKAGTLAFALLYTIGALSTKSSLLWVLMLGRLAGGIGTSLLFSAPESWLVGEHSKGGFDGKWLGQTFGLAYAGDSLVAISAGQLAGVAAAARGPCGPFEISVVFLAMGALIAMFQWKENVSPINSAESKGPTISDAFQVMLADKKILLVGTVQSLFEGAMYIFVLQWAPSLIAVVAGGAVPFGKVFSCFMASCLLGSTLFGALARRGFAVEKTCAGMLTAATVAMGVATAMGSSLVAVIASFLVFEACVGMYFPSIGTLRSKYVPESHRSVIVNIFGVPLNLIVVSVFLSIKSLGVSGALACSTACLAVAAAAAVALVATIAADEGGASGGSLGQAA
ncbi:hypothetical protein T484DRAFT_1632152 [Baffinella frigidus]|nr:hypothetical protein T484DRAFT_1632152 [Cryptophyta sp. CCMP2293]